MTTRTYSLTLDNGSDLTITAEDAGRTWNGWAVPILTTEQAATVGRAIGESLTAGPADGLTWERS